MRKGGYKIISLKSSTLYEDIESNYYKPLLLTDIVIDGVDKHDLFVNVEVWDGNYIIDAYDRTIVITPENQVTMTEGGKHLYLNSITISFDDEDSESGYMYINIYSNNEIKTVSDLDAFISNYNSNNKFSISGYQIASQTSILGIYKVGSEYQYVNNNDEDKEFTIDSNNSNFKSIQIF